MLPEAVRKRIQKVVLFCLVTVTLLVTPHINLDPFNVPKFLILVVCGFTLLGFMAPFVRNFYNSEARGVMILSSLMVASLIVIFLVHRSPHQLYGTYGRNTGLLAYIALILIFMAIAIVSNQAFVGKVIYFLIITGAINANYGLIQWLGLDPIDGWITFYSPIQGTLGNPNFVSALLGIASVASLGLALSNTGKIKRVMLFINVLISQFVVFVSDSIQGLLIFLIGFILIFYYRYLRNLRLIYLRYLYFALCSILGIFGILGLLNSGPFAKLLYTQSIEARGYYWRAGINMTVENLFFGVGLDAYGDWFRYFREEKLVSKYGPDLVTNAAHNVFVDIASSGGLVLFIPYLLIIGLVIKSAINILRNSKGYDVFSVVLVGCWLAYLVQSFVSINQLSIAMWGWALGALVIGYDHHRIKEDIDAFESSRKKLASVPASVIVTGSVGCIFGLIICIWPFTKDVSFFNALKSQDALKVQQTAKKFPENSYYYYYAAQILLQNKLPEESLDMSISAVKYNPRDYFAWKLILENPRSNLTLKEEAKANLTFLDPQYQD